MYGNSTFGIVPHYLVKEGIITPQSKLERMHRMDARALRGKDAKAKGHGEIIYKVSLNSSCMLAIKLFPVMYL
jgi:hypothetical protein